MASPDRSPSTSPDPSPETPRGYDAWIAVVKNYQKCQRLLSHTLDALGITVAQHEVLIAVARAEGIDQKALAERLLVVKSNVSGLLRRMEEQGLVRRRTDPADARHKRITLTRRGRRLAAKSFALQAEIVERMMGSMDDRELEQQRRMARRIGRTLDELLAQEG